MYTASTRVTFLRLSSCQKWDSLLGIERGLVTASYDPLGYESNAPRVGVIYWTLLLKEAEAL